MPFRRLVEDCGVFIPLWRGAPRIELGPHKGEVGQPVFHNAYPKIEGSARGLCYSNENSMSTHASRFDFPDSVNVPGSPTAVTLAIYVKCDDVNSVDPRFFQKGNSTSSADHFWMLGAVAESGGNWQPRCRLKVDSTTLTAVTTGSVAPLGEWVVFSAEWESGYLSSFVNLFLDGVDQDVSSGFSAGSFNGGGTEDFAIGNLGAGTQPLVGQMAWMGVWPWRWGQELQALVAQNPFWYAEQVSYSSFFVLSDGGGGGGSATAGLPQIEFIALEATATAKTAATVGLPQAEFIALEATVSAQAQATVGLPQVEFIALEATAEAKAAATTGLPQVEFIALEATATAKAAATAGLPQVEFIALEATADAGGSNATAGLPQVEFIALEATATAKAAATAGLPQVEFIALEAAGVGGVSADAGLPQLEFIALEAAATAKVTATVGLAELEFIALESTVQSPTVATAGLPLLEFIALGATGQSAADPIVSVEYDAKVEFPITYDAHVEFPVTKDEEVEFA